VELTETSPVVPASSKVNLISPEAETVMGPPLETKKVPEICIIVPVDIKVRVLLVAKVKLPDEVILPPWILRL